MSLSDYTEDDALAVARRVMYELLGRRWVWPYVTTTERLEIPSNQNFVNLAGRPVHAVAAVTRLRRGNPDEPLEFVLENHYRLRLVGEFDCNRLAARTFIEVTYTYGSPPPSEISVAIDVFAKELLLAINGDEDCKLPEYVKSVTRDGITFEMMTPQDFLDDGRTGLPVVDSAIAHFNPAKSSRKARVMSRTSPPPRRRGTTQSSY